MPIEKEKTIFNITFLIEYSAISLDCEILNESNLIFSACVILWNISGSPVYLSHGSFAFSCIFFQLVYSRWFLLFRVVVLLLHHSTTSIILAKILLPRILRIHG